MLRLSDFIFKSGFGDGSKAAPGPVAVPTPVLQWSTVDNPTPDARIEKAIIASDGTVAFISKLVTRSKSLISGSNQVQGPKGTVYQVAFSKKIYPTVAEAEAAALSLMQEGGTG